MAKTTAKQKKNTPWMGGFQAFSIALKNVKNDYQPALFFVCILLAIQIASRTAFGEQVFTLEASNTPRQFPTGPDAIQMVANFILLPFMLRYSLSLARNEHKSIGELLRVDLKLYAILFVNDILALILVITSIAAFVVPFIIILPWVYLLDLVIVDQKKGPIEAFSYAKRLVSGRKSEVWGVIGVSVVAAFATALLILIPIIGSAGVLFVNVISQAALALVYVWLTKQKPHEKTAKA